MSCGPEGPEGRKARSAHSSTGCEILSTSSTSIPRYRTVLSSFVCESAPNWNPAEILSLCLHRPQLVPYERTLDSW
jgi:hypothetical protein